MQNIVEINKVRRKSNGLIPFDVVANFRNKRKLEIAVPTKGMLPVKSGNVRRSSVTDVTEFFSDYYYVQADFDYGLLDLLEHLAIYNGELSQAVDNIQSLANTKHTLKFPDKVTAEEQKEMMNHLKVCRKRWYSNSEGIYSLINDLLNQLAINGALSAEIVPNLELNGVEKVVLVAPKNVRFKYQRENDVFVPFQILTKRISSLDNVSEVELNPVTYKYISLGRMRNKPQGIPPLLSALEGVGINRNIFKNFKYLIKKVGAFGFLQVLLNAPKPTVGQTQEDYFASTKQYLEAVVPEIQKGMESGFVTGFKGEHEFQVNSFSGEKGAAEELVNISDRKMMSGLKQDPMMFGRNFTTTETLGSVILLKMGSQMKKYQKAIGAFLEELYSMELFLAGYSVDFLEVEFEAALVGDKHRERSQRQIQITNLNLLYEQGIISQEQRAVELGYEKPDQDEPRVPLNTPIEGASNDPNNPSGSPKNGEDDVTAQSNDRMLIDTYERLLFASHIPYMYAGVSRCSCTGNTGTVKSQFNKALETIEDFVQQYYDETVDVYSIASKSTVRDILSAIGSLGSGATEQAVLDRVFATLFSTWGTTFGDSKRQVITKWVGAAYRFFRNDRSVLTGLNADDIPDPVFGVVDRRALNYFTDSDDLYMGRFVTDADFRKKLTETIKDLYLNRELPIGDIEANMKQLRARLGNVFEGEEWKLRRIIETTVNRMRNIAAVSYMQQAEVEQYEIVEVMDTITCDWCRQIDGMKFNVNRSTSLASESLNGSPELVKVTSPFLTTLYKKPEDMEGLSAGDLQNAGFIGLPPSHPHCRGTIVAVL